MQEKSEISLRALVDRMDRLEKLPPKKRRLNAKQSAEYLGISPRTFKAYRQNRELPYYRVGHCNIVCDVADLDAWMARRRVEAIG